MSVVLMYHALHEGADTSRIDPEDRPYAVSTAAFDAQLDIVAARLASCATAPHGAPPVTLTFDDGHASNVELALPMLRARGLRATFFVTSGFVGAREHFVDEAMLRTLARAGMTVGGHGRTHRFFDDLDEAQAREELGSARAALERAVGGPVRSMSFPGGRHDARSRRLAREAGVTALFDSRCAVADGEALSHALATASNEVVDTADVPPRDPRDDPGGDLPRDPRLDPGGRAGADPRDADAARAPLPRVAVRADTDMDTFTRMIEPDPAWYTAARRGERVRHLARRVLGNRIYHGLYTTLRAG